MSVTLSSLPGKFKCSLLNVIFCPDGITPNSGLTGPNNTYIYIYIYIYTHIYKYVFMYSYICIHICTYVYIYKYVSTYHYHHYCHAASADFSDSHS